MIPLHASAPPVRALLAFAALVAPYACTEGPRADGEPCSSAFDCRSGACLTRSTGARVCAHRCATSADCAPGDVCGRYDFRGRDDGGSPEGPKADVLRVCRAPLSARCAAGCAPGERCGAGLCARPCASPADCGGRACERDGCGDGRCAAPCDALADCPEGHACNLAVADTAGHGECIPLTDAAPADASRCDATP